MIVAARSQNILFDSSNAQGRQVTGRFTLPCYLFVIVVDDELRTRAVIKRDLMFRAVHRTHLPGDITQRQREGVQIVRQCRPHEREGHMNFFVLEIVDAASRRDLQAGLPHHGNRGWFHAHQAIRSAIHANQTVQRLRPLGPMQRRTFRERIGIRPHAQVRIKGHQRDRRRTKSLRECRHHSKSRQSHRNDKTGFP